MIKSLNFKILKAIIFIVAFVFSTFLSQAQLFKAKIKTVLKPQTSIRALLVTEDNHLWFAGANNTFGCSFDGGKTWDVDSINFHGQDIHFRGIAKSGSGVNIMGVDNPAFFFRTEDEGLNWLLSYFEDEPGVFYDAMAFFDDDEGIAFGDPLDSCFSVLKTYDSGKTWQKLTCSTLPKSKNGQGAFAASNTNIAIQGDSVWFVTGGFEADVLFSPDRGKTWELQACSFIDGSEMTGMFSVDFYDAKTGFIIGGDWENQTSALKNKAKTIDGGKTWEILADQSLPPYQSCVKYVPNSKAKRLLSVGMPGVFYSEDGGEHWVKLSDEAFYTIDFLNETTAFLAGNKRIAKLVFSK
ncbi:MAG: WD40/YVTN/BNR-like repeat-containing protein [Flavobacteriales bacterium]